MELEKYWQRCVLTVKLRTHSFSLFLLLEKVNLFSFICDKASKNRIIIFAHFYFHV